MRKILTIVLSIIAINVNAQHLMFENIELGCHILKFEENILNQGYIMESNYIRNDTLWEVDYEGKYMSRNVRVDAYLNNLKVFQLHIGGTLIGYYFEDEQISNNIRAKLLKNGINAKVYSEDLDETRTEITYIYNLIGGYLVIRELYVTENNTIDASIDTYYVDAIEGEKAHKVGIFVAGAKYIWGD